MKRYIFSTLLIVAACFGIRAQQVLTLDQCREMALQNNVAIKNGILMSRAAQETRKEAFTKYFPSVSATGIAFTTNRGLLQHKFKGEVPLPPVPGLTDGGTFGYDYNLTLFKKGVAVGLSAVQPVFMGGEIVNGNKLAEVGEAVAELQSRQSKEQVRQTVEQYYWQLAVLKGERKTINDLIAMLDTLTRQVQVAVDAGVTLRNDLLEVQLRRNEMVTDSIQLENGINVVSSLLAQYVGLGIEPIDISEAITPEDTIPLADSLYVNPIDALSSTVDYQLLTQGVRAAEISKRMTVGANLPKLAIGGNLSESNLSNQWHPSATLFATLIIPITDWWGGSHAIKKSKLQLQVAKNNLEDNSELLMVRMKNSWDDLSTSYRRIGVARLSIEQSAENLRLNDLYYKAGTVTITDLLKSQTLYRQAHDRYVEAVGQYNVDVTKYLIDTGR